MKKIIIFLAAALLLSFGVNAQTLSTDTYSDANGNLPPVGTNFDVPIDVTNIGDILTFTVYLEYDNTVLSYTGFTNQMVADMTVEHENANTIKVMATGAFPAGATIDDGKLIDLQFNYLGGYTDRSLPTIYE